MEFYNCNINVLILICIALGNLKPVFHKTKHIKSLEWILFNPNNIEKKTK